MFLGHEQGIAELGDKRTCDLWLRDLWFSNCTCRAIVLRRTQCLTKECILEDTLMSLPTMSEWPEMVKASASPQLVSSRHERTRHAIPVWRRISEHGRSRVEDKPKEFDQSRILVSLQTMSLFLEDHSGIVLSFEIGCVERLWIAPVTTSSLSGPFARW